jgi:uncharacterized protein YcsI (UPF0317 family)
MSVYAQANVLAIPRSLAFETMPFAQRNPKPCPVLDVLGAGEALGVKLPAPRICRTGLWASGRQLHRAVG